MNNENIRDATLNDLNDINYLIQVSKSHWGYDEDFLKRYIKKFCITPEYLKNNTVKLLYSDHKLIGVYSFSFDKDNLLELDNFFIHKDFIGKGYGLKLWNLCCHTAIELGKNQFTLWSDPYAATFYLKMGCEKIGVRQSPMLPNRYPPVLRWTQKTQ